MAIIIPALNQKILSRMTAGEKKFARCLKLLLDDDCLCWYDIPIGEKRRYPDFIILHPRRGLLVLEVKDWKTTSLKRIDKTEVTLLTDNGEQCKPHPLEQARECMFPVIDKLSSDPKLRQTGKHQGNLIMPYAWGAVFTNITRQQMQKALTDSVREILLPDHLMVYKDDLSEKSDPKTFQDRLWRMFAHPFKAQLNNAQIDRIRWHLFPEIRIGQFDCADVDCTGENQTDHASTPLQSEQDFPDVVKIMDVRQEVLARNLGSGHRIIHGVAGSGKTLILYYRCQLLAQTSSKPILVLCYNKSLAAKLKSFITAKGLIKKVRVHSFHSWCRMQVGEHKIPFNDNDSESDYSKRLVETVIDAVDKGTIPCAQYEAVLIDEGHDLEAAWLKLVVQMIDPTSGSLLLLYDDAQDIYNKRSGLGFTLSSVGIQAKGRSIKLRKNYRNTQEILNFAKSFVQDQFAQYQTKSESRNDDHIPLIVPEAAGVHGDEPEQHSFKNIAEEAAFTRKCLQQWQQQGVPWKDMAVLYFDHDSQGQKVVNSLEHSDIPHLFMKGREQKKAYDPFDDKVTVVTVASSKGLEFPYVVIVGVGKKPKYCEDEKEYMRLLYVGMTRAQTKLMLTTSVKKSLKK